MTILHVTDWNEHYENNRSRKVKDLAWVPVPNNHDGESYSRLMLRKDAAQIFSAWILILQVASRCHRRGTLVRSDKTPHDSESLALKTRAPEGWFSTAIPVLVQMGWLKAEVIDDPKLAPSRHEPATELPLDCHRGDEERKKEGKERKNSSPAGNGTDEIDPRHGQICQRWGEVFGSAWNAKYTFSGRDAKALQILLPRVTETAEEIITIAIRAWERAKQDNYVRHCRHAATIHGLCTYFNEIRVELQTPKAAGNGVPVKSATPRPDIYTEPPNWREKAQAKWPEAELPELWSELSATARNDLLAK